MGSTLTGMSELLYLNMNLTGLECGVPPTYIEATEIAIRCDYLRDLLGNPNFFGLIDGKFTSTELL